MRGLIQTWTVVLRDVDLLIWLHGRSEQCEKCSLRKTCSVCVSLENEQKWSCLEQEAKSTKWQALGLYGTKPEKKIPVVRCLCQMLGVKVSTSRFHWWNNYFIVLRKARSVTDDKSGKNQTMTIHFDPVLLVT